MSREFKPWSAGWVDHVIEVAWVHTPSWRFYEYYTYFSPLLTALKPPVNWDVFSPFLNEPDNAAGLHHRSSVATSCRNQWILTFYPFWWHPSFPSIPQWSQRWMSEQDASMFFHLLLCTFHCHILAFRVTTGPDLSNTQEHRAVALCLETFLFCFVLWLAHIFARWSRWTLQEHNNQEQVEEKVSHSWQMPDSGFSSLESPLKTIPADISPVATFSHTTRKCSNNDLLTTLFQTSTILSGEEHAELHVFISQWLGNRKHLFHPHTLILKVENNTLQIHTCYSKIFFIYRNDSQTRRLKSFKAVMRGWVKHSQLWRRILKKFIGTVIAAMCSCLFSTTSP